MSNHVRVAYVCADGGIPVFGQKGCSIHVQEFLRALLRKGAQVWLYASRLGGDTPQEFSRLPIRQIPALRGPDPRAREIAAVASNQELLRRLEQDGPFDLVYERYSLFSYSAMQYARASSAIGLLEVNAPLIEEQALYRTLVNRGAAEHTSRAAFAAASALLAVSSQVADYLNEFPDAAGRVCVIPNGVDTARFSPRSARNAFRPFTVGFVGSLKPWHGVSGLLAAFDSLLLSCPDARLLIVGDGPERSALERDANRLSARHSIYFTGALAHSSIPSQLGQLDVAVAPYPRLPHFYFSPLKIYEYMAAGLPVVASRSGQVAQIIQDGVSGLLYEPDDTAALRGCLEALYNDRDLRRRLGEAGRQWVTSGHSWDAVVEQVLRLAKCGYSGSLQA